MNSKKPIPLDSELAQKIQALDKELNDAIKRFTTLIKIAKADKLVTFYKKKLEERKDFKSQLRPIILNLQLKKTRQGTVTGAFARLHANLKAIFDDDEDEVSLTKAMYHEESLLHEYDMVLRKPEILTKNIIKLLQKQRDAVEKDVNEIKHLNDIK